jgi:hypothetical protein
MFYLVIRAYRFSSVNEQQEAARQRAEQTRQRAERQKQKATKRLIPDSDNEDNEDLVERPDNTV